MVRMMGSSLEADLGDIFNAPDERILKAVEKAGNRCLNPPPPPRTNTSPPPGLFKPVGFGTTANNSPGCDHLWKC